MPLRISPLDSATIFPVLKRQVSSQAFEILFQQHLEPKQNAGSVHGRCFAPSRKRSLGGFDGPADLV